ncbi:MAG: phosphoglycerate dehydrogenase [Chitinophagales bacterium]
MEQMAAEAVQEKFSKDNIQILLLERIHPIALETFNAAGYSNVELLDRALSEEELIEKIKSVRLIGIRSKSQITAKVLEHAKKLLGIGCFCIGTNQVDLETATQDGVAVFNSPYSNTRSVAELVIAETVMLMRGIPEKSTAAHEGRWLKQAEGSFEVRGKTMGIIGYGHIGSQVSVLAESMGLKVLYYDIVPKLPLGNAEPVDTLEELLNRSDVVTLHVPATSMTKNMFRAEQIAQMKKGAFLINLSRGTVVDIEALKVALDEKYLAGAAIDVFPLEPKEDGELFRSPLQGLPNVILTPHIGGSTEEAQVNIGKDAANKLINYLEKGTTVGSHTIPELSLTPYKNAHRILNVHHNVPGVLSEINGKMSEHGINILGQHLATNDKIGYVVIDVAKSGSHKALKEIKKIKHTIQARILY